MSIHDYMNTIRQWSGLEPSLDDVIFYNDCTWWSRMMGTSPEQKQKWEAFSAKLAILFVEQEELNAKIEKLNSLLVNRMNEIVDSGLFISSEDKKSYSVEPVFSSYKEK